MSRFVVSIIRSIYDSWIFSPRTFTRTHPKHANSQYVFDLDGDEVEVDVATHHELFSVDSEFAGEFLEIWNFPKYTHFCCKETGRVS